ncbi:hypothetical protein [Dysgonomonas sp. ZJ709]|uniref:hypothetical protein n=1 Tax=Dysgonomonas sp. ZJ709 TaxID=2709797 RepID=UPI0013EB4C2A|nr:hypothetical protein [Dysgonomonas sp. ZJ709]
MKPICFQNNNKTWCCISIFYSRKDWSILLPDILSFYKQNTELLDCCLTSLSEERGEHIRIIFSSTTDKTDALKFEIINHFQSFLNCNPSINSKEFPFGKAIWCYYPNNSILWNRFELTYDYLDLSQKLTLLTPFLLENDMSIDHIFSVALFLSTRLLKFIEYTDRLRTFDILMAGLAKKMDISIEDLINKIDLLTIMEIINSYWEHEEEIQCESLYVEWIKESERILLTSSDSFNYGRLVQIICEHLGLNDPYYLMIISFLRQWFISNKESIS